MVTQVWNADLCSHRKGGSLKIPSPPGNSQAVRVEGSSPRVCAGKEHQGPQGPCTCCGHSLGMRDVRATQKPRPPVALKHRRPHPALSVEDTGSGAQHPTCVVRALSVSQVG